MIGAWVLAALSRRPGASDYSTGCVHWTLESALTPLRREFPGFDSLVRGKRVADFGCGTGFQAVALALQGCSVLGIDINARWLDAARRRAAAAAVPPHQLCFTDRVRSSDRETCDVVVSLNSFEHFPDPDGALTEMTSILRPGGLLLITFGPPWFAPYGSHMHFFTRLPWVNLLFSEAAVMQVRQRYRPDGALSYEQVESGLNRMTVGQFEELVMRSGLTLEHRAYRGIRGFNLLTRIPMLRELFTTNVAVILRRPASGAGSDVADTAHS